MKFRLNQPGANELWIVLASSTISVNTKIEISVASLSNYKDHHMQPEASLQALVSFAGGYWSNIDQNRGINCYSVAMK